MNRQKIFLIILLFFVAIIGFIIISYTTAYSIGVSPDSAVYISVAENLAKGDGLTTYEGKPLVAFPPVYPAFLAVVTLLQGDVFQAARYLQALLYALNIVLSGLILYRLSLGAIAPVLAGIIILVPAMPLIYVHSHAWSEPLFILFSLLALWSLAEYLHRPKLLFLIGSTLCITLAILTRYVGLALVPTAIIALWLPRLDFSIKRRAPSTLVVLMSLVGIGLWLVRNTLTKESAIDRSISYHPMLIESIRQGYYSISTWLFIMQFNQWLRAGLFVAIALVVLFLLLRRFLPLLRQERRMDISQVMLSVITVYWTCYILVALATTTLLDINPVLDARILAPLYPTMVIFSLTLAWDFLNSVPALWKFGLAAPLLLIFLYFQITKTLPQVNNLHVHSLEYLSSAWTGSSILRYLEELPDGIPIYSNGPDLIYARSGRSAVFLPERTDRYSGFDNSKYQDEIENLASGLKRRGVVVWINKINWRYYLANVNELSPYLCITPIFHSEDGVVYQFCANASSPGRIGVSIENSGNSPQIYLPVVLQRNIARLPLGSVTPLKEAPPCDEGQECYRVQVSCTQVIEPLRAELRISRPPTEPVLGTILVFSGGPGVEFYGDYTAENKPVLQELVDAGYRIVEARWDEDRSNPWYKSASGVSEGHQNLSCRSATLAQWVHDQFNREGTPYCALGHSNGASQLGYSLSFYGLGEIFKAAVFESGPNWSRIDQACLNDNPVYSNIWLPPPEASIGERDNIDLAFGFNPGTGPCKSLDASYRQEFLATSLAWGNWRYYFPATRISFLFGELDPSQTAGQGKVYLNLLLKTGSPFVSSRTVGGAGHMLSQTPTGAGAIVDALVNTCVP